MQSEFNRGIETFEQNTWEKEYAEALEVFKKEYPIAFDLMEVGGVHPERKLDIENPYLDGEIDSEDFRNVGEHNVAVGLCAKKIANQLVKAGILSTQGRDEIVLRALMHDANKRFEVMRKKAKQAGKNVDVYGEKGYETMFNHLLKKDPNLASTLGAYLKSAGMETGHTSLKDFISVNEHGTVYLKYSTQLPEMIVHLADDMTSSLEGKTNWVTAKKRMELSDFQNRYPFLYKEGFGFDVDGNVIGVSDIATVDSTVTSVKSFAEWQETVAKLISKELAWMLRISGDPEKAIVDISNR